ncbi:MAG: helix-turn-helix domain-containing protein [Candidatus Methanoperedens sp.]|nr:helix-turn-helix domain-containing protein [Candidatus Methanoperedens sp.]
MRWLLDGNVLENESCAAIYRYIKENPGAYPLEIMRETTIVRGTVLYHLDVLLYAGMVACLKDGRLKKYRAAQKVGV